MAGIALELGALAFVGYVVMAAPRSARGPSIPADDGFIPADAGVASADDSVAPRDEGVERADDAVVVEPMAFIADDADAGARYYRAADGAVELIAGFYSDGRVRLAGAQNHRFAGMLQSGHADLLDLANNQWSEVFVQVTPAGTMQLELRGGPYDAHVLTCETLKS